MTYSITHDPAHPDLQAMRPSTLLRHMAYGQKDREAFRCLTQADMDPTRPLFVLVHPGDMVESRDGWDNTAAAEAVCAFWHHNAAGLRRELKAARQAGADIVVLHRESSVEFVDTRRLYSAARTLWKTHLCALFSKGSALWGDDLDGASDWLLDAARARTRPTIHLAGAYACPDHGCLTHVGQRLLGAGIPAGRITVSPFSPPGNTPGPVWRPMGAVPMDIPDALAALYAALPA